MAGRNASPTSIASARSCRTNQASSGSASRASSTASPLMSTPPTSLGDESSVLSDNIKMDATADTPADTPATPAVPPPQPLTQPTSAAPSTEGRRSVRSSRSTIVTYNVQMLAGTAIHTPTKYLEKHHKNVLHGALEEALPAHVAQTPPKKRRVAKVDADDLNDPAAVQLATETAQAAQRRTSSRVDLRKEALRNVTAAGEAVVRKGAEQLSNVTNRVQRALRGALATETGPSGRSTRGTKATQAREEDAGEDEDEQEEEEYIEPKSKKWETQGLYVGQHREFDARLKESQNRLRRQSRKMKESKILPLPMFAGERMLSGDYRRDFKLPFDVYNPLPRRVKVDGWVKLQKNRFIGDASALWKHDKHDSSTCQCSPADGCGEHCHNRIMSYECDGTNCRLTPEQCSNRPFAQLKARAKGNGYDYGVEVMDTPDKGYGVRAMRSFEPYQIIVEYAGEIITQAECERRMKQIYKKDKCYYLMSFDNKMIIDATRGTIARFVNHSCEPNCGMFKWTVSGEPRMALFAGPRGIMTGEELTYDYNFDPFSTKNIQACRCGTRSCRGVLGPKPKHQPKEEKSFASSLIAGTKRKLQDMFGPGSASSSAQNSPKKRKVGYMAYAAITKKENAEANSAAAREKAARDAAEQAAQKASRESRAMRRHSSMTLSTQRSKVLNKTSRHSLPSVVSRRKTTVSLNRRTPRAVPRPGVLKPARKTGLTSLLQRKAGPSKSERSKSPLRSPSPESDVSVNITPASLRSASRKFTQTKLNFELSGKRTSTARQSLSKKAETPQVPDSEDEEVEDDEDMEEFAPSAKRMKTNTGRAKSVRRTARGTFTKSVRATKRVAGVAKAAKEMGGLRGGAGKSTIRLLSGVDD